MVSPEAATVFTLCLNGAFAGVIRRCLWFINFIGLWFIKYIIRRRMKFWPKARGRLFFSYNCEFVFVVDICEWRVMDSSYERFGQDMLPALARHPCFASIFVERYIALDAVETLAEVPPIDDAFKLVGSLLSALASSRPDDATIKGAAAMCADAARLTPAVLVTPASEDLLDFVGSFVGRVRALQQGEVLVTPGHWRAASGILFVLSRSSHGETYDLAVCNTGEGVRFHPARATPLDGRQTLPTLMLRGIAEERVVDSSIWCAQRY